MKSSSIDYSKYNYGFCLLKMLMAFEVILAHFCNWDEYNPVLVWPFRELVSLAVSCFVLMSFYLMTDFFLSRDLLRYKNRIKKLIIPQIGWAIIYFATYLFLNICFKSNLPLKPFDLFWQILTGHSMNLNPTMWYQFNIIVITSIFFFVFKKTNNQKGFNILVLLFLFSYFMQYSGINRILFQDLPFELKKPLGRILELIPFAVVGFSMKYFDLLERLKKYRYPVMLFCVVAFLFGFRIPWIDPKGFDYSGFVKLYLSLWIVVFANLVPFEFLNERIKKVLFSISRYTLGIYCSHRLIYTLLYVFAPGLNLHSFEKCVLIYIISYLFCFTLEHLFTTKTVKSLID